MRELGSRRQDSWGDKHAELVRGSPAPTGILKIARDLRREVVAMRNVRRVRAPLGPRLISARGCSSGRVTSGWAKAGNPAPEWRMEPGSGLWLEVRYIGGCRGACGAGAAEDGHSSPNRRSSAQGQAVPATRDAAFPQDAHPSIA